MQTMPIKISTSDTADAGPRYKLGDIIEFLDNGTVYRFRYCFNDSGGTLAQGELVHQKTTAANGYAAKTTGQLARQAYLGFVYYTAGVANQKYFWACCKGQCAVKSVASTNPTAHVTPVAPSGATAGQVTATISGVEHTVLGVFAETDGSVSGGDLLQALVDIS